MRLPSALWPLNPPTARVRPPHTRDEATRWEATEGPWGWPGRAQETLPHRPFLRPPRVLQPGLSCDPLGGDPRGSPQLGSILISGKVCDTCCLPHSAPSPLPGPPHAPLLLAPPLFPSACAVVEAHLLSAGDRRPVPRGQGCSRFVHCCPLSQSNAWHTAGVQ